MLPPEAGLLFQHKISAVALACALITGAAAQQTPKAALDTSETLYAMMAGLNSCGYDQDLGQSSPIRNEIRTDIGKALAASDEAERAHRELCAFYRDHHQNDAGRDLAQYISLALNLGAPPDFAPTTKEADLPPDATYVLGVTRPLASFYKAVDLHKIYEERRNEFDGMVERFHTPVSNVLVQTDLYLRLPISGFLGRRFVVYLEPLIGPGQVNERTYGSNYFLVLSPTVGNSINIDAVRHTYLHYVLEPLILKRSTTLKRLEPLLNSVKMAPLEESYKEDISLLVTESLIRAIEARMLGNGKAPDTVRERAADRAMAEGYILTRYFYDLLINFEKDPAGFQDALPDMLFAIDVSREKKRASEIQFAAAADPELVRPQVKSAAPMLLDMAEDRLAAGDADSAVTLAQRAFDNKEGDPSRALFILARASTLKGDVQAARTYFERTLELAHEPRIVAWSHIYLGRILDLQENRQAALVQYHAALSAGDTTPDTRAAAERGIEKAYEPRRRQ